MSRNQDEMIRENAGDEMNKNIQSPAGAKTLPDPDSNTGGVADPETSTNGQSAGTGSVASEQAALHQEAEEAKAAFAGTGDVPGAAGIIESDADGPAATGAPTSSGGGTPAPAGVDTEAPERARELAEKEDSAKDSRQPTMGEMLAAELGSEPSMKWESKIVEKLAGSSGAMESEDLTEK